MHARIIGKGAMVQIELESIYDLQSMNMGYWENRNLWGHRKGLHIDDSLRMNVSCLIKGLDGTAGAGDGLKITRSKILCNAITAN